MNAHSRQVSRSSPICRAGCYMPHLCSGKPSECLDIPWAMLDSFEENIEIRQTVKGKGVPAWEGKISSHYYSDPGDI